LDKIKHFSKVSSLFKMLRVTCPAMPYVQIFQPLYTMRRGMKNTVTHRWLWQADLTFTP
jgi:hypothetical protein